MSISSSYLSVCVCVLRNYLYLFMDKTRNQMQKHDLIISLYQAPNASSKLYWHISKHIQIMQLCYYMIAYIVLITEVHIHKYIWGKRVVPASSRVRAEDYETSRWAPKQPLNYSASSSSWSVAPSLFCFLKLLLFCDFEIQRWNKQREC